jgi:hypothetical protein
LLRGHLIAMALHFHTETPARLLGALKKAVDDRHVTTWTYDEDGDFTHTSENWNSHAWFKPRVDEGRKLSFYILAPNEVQLSSLTYAVYHSRLVSAMLVHFDELFSSISVSSMPEGEDAVSSDE